MPRILLSCLIGLFSVFAWFVGGSFFEGHGGHPVQENVAGCIALILYIVLGQVLLPRDPTADTAEDWRVRASMAAPLVLFAFLILSTEGGDPISPAGLDALAAGCTGVLLGGVLGAFADEYLHRRTLRTQRNLNCSEIPAPPYMSVLLQF